MQKRNVLRSVGIVAMLSISVAVLLNVLLLQINLPQYSERYQAASEILYSPPFWKQVLTSGLLIPIIEEFLFRGIVFRLLRKKCSFLWAMMISAILFGVYHGNLVQFVYATICGMVLAYLYEKSCRVWSSIWSHMMMNLCAILLTHFGVLSWIMEQDLRVIVVLFMCLGVIVMSWKTYENCAIIKVKS